jgi:hypothetical protein
MAPKGPSILQALLIAFSGAGLAIYGCMGAMSAGSSENSAPWIRTLFAGVSVSALGSAMAIGFMLAALAGYFGSDPDRQSGDGAAAAQRQPPLLPLLAGIAAAAALTLSCWVGMMAASPVGSAFKWSQLGLLAGIVAFGIGTLTLGYFIVGAIAHSIRKKPTTDRESGS